MNSPRLSWIFLVCVVILTALHLFGSEFHNRIPPVLTSNAPVISQEETDINSFDNAAPGEWEILRLMDPETGTIPRNIRSREVNFVKNLPKNYTFERVDALGKPSGISQSKPWTFRGPENIGGRTRALGIDASNPSVIIAGGVSGGMWRSGDGGMSWTKTTQPDQLHSTASLAQDTRPGKTNTWYYGTGERYGRSASARGALYRGDGIYKSTDGGRSWNALESTSAETPATFDNSFEYVWRIAVDRSNQSEDEVYAATIDAIHRSTDGGESWQMVLGNFTSPYSSATDVVVNREGVVYAALDTYPFTSEGLPENHGIHRSPDGINWTAITPSGWPNLRYRTVLAVSESNPDILYAICSGPQVGQNEHLLMKYTYLSGDGSGAGGMWEDFTGNLPNSPEFRSSFFSQNGYDLLIEIKPNDENTVIIGGTDLYRSTTGFSTDNATVHIGGYPTESLGTDFNWGYLFRDQYGNHHADQHAVSFDPVNPDILVSAHDGGLSRTNNISAPGVTWSSLNSGYNTTQFYTVAIDHSAIGDNVIIGGTQDNGTWFTNSPDGSDPWTKLYGADGSFCAIADGKSHFYVSTQYRSPMRFELNSDGTGVSWTSTTPANTFSSDFLFINPFALDPNNSDIMYLATIGGIWRNRNLSAIPQTVSTRSTVTSGWFKLYNPQYIASSVTALGAAKVPKDRLYYSIYTNKGRLYRIDDTTTFYAHHADIYTNRGLPQAWVSSISVDPVNGDHVVISFSNYHVPSIFLSTNAGSSWVDVSGNLEENPDGSGDGPSVRWIETLKLEDKTIWFAATSAGLYSTTELDGSATTWTQESPETIGNVVVDMIDARSTDGLVVAATHGNGIYSANFQTEANAILVSEFRLRQNYPNPFNADTRIELVVPEPSHVTLDIYSVTGAFIKNIMSEEMPAGVYSAAWDGKNTIGFDVASGIYICRMRAGSFSTSRKMTLIR